MTITNISSEGIAKIYRDKFWKLHEIPKKILSGRGPQFVSRFMEGLTKALETKMMLSITYHPQSDRQTKRINQEIGMFLQHHVNYQQNNWMKWIAAVEFHYNNKKHAATSQTLFVLNFGRHSWKGNLKIQMEIPKLEEFLMKLQRSWEEATKLIKSAQKNMKKQYDKKQRNPQGLKVRDNMWLENKNIHLNRPLKKLDQRRYRLFRIIKEIGQGAFQLKLLEEYMIHDMFNEDLLTECRKPHYPEQHMEPAPPPVIINEEEEYKVEEV